MKKSTNIIFASALALATVFVGCKTEYTEDPDAVYIEGERVDFTAQVISSDGASKSTAGLEGATVTLSAGDETMTMTTDASGNAHFSDLEEGNYSVSVEMTGYSTMSALVNITSSTNDDGASSAQFALFGGTSTITGMVWANTDATNDTDDTGLGTTNLGSFAPNVAPTTPAVTVTASLNASNFSTWNTAGSGVTISGISYDGASATGTCDATGAYTITVPGAASGLSYNLRFPDFVFQQVVWDPLTAGAKTTEREQMVGGNSNVTVYSNETIVEDYDYGDN